MSSPIYSQVYTAVARTLLRLDHGLQQPHKYYSPEWHRLITRIAIYESRGFTRTVQFGLTPGIIVDLWLDTIRPRVKLHNAIMPMLGYDAGPWEPIKVMGNLTLAIIHCRLRADEPLPMELDGQATYWLKEYCNMYVDDEYTAVLWGKRGGYFTDIVSNFETAHPDPRLNLSPEEYRQMSTAPGAAQIGLQL